MPVGAQTLVPVDGRHRSRLIHKTGDGFLFPSRGIHPTATGRLERGTREARLKTILRLTDGLRTQPGRLLNYLGGRPLTPEEF
jgi:hypothetical protein